MYATKVKIMEITQKNQPVRIEFNFMLYMVIYIKKNIWSLYILKM